MSSSKGKRKAVDVEKLERFLNLRVARKFKIPTEFPLTLHIKDFVIKVETIDKITSWDSRRQIASGVSGTGWLNFNCGGLPQLSLEPKIPEGLFRIWTSLEVVSHVTNPQTQISLENAQLIKPNIALGDNLKVELDLQDSDLQSLLQTDYGISAHLLQKKGDVLVKFEKVKVKVIDSDNRVGRIIEGNAVYPANPRIPSIVKLILNGFTAFISSLVISPTQAIADIEVELPKSIASEESCKPATLKIGKTAITSDCQFYAEKLGDAFGPWIIGDTGMIASGTGFIADFNSYVSPLSMAGSWKGIVLKNGVASGEKISPRNSNTGFNTGKYTFSNALISDEGLEAEFNLKEPHTFQTLHPLNYTISYSTSTLNIYKSRIGYGSLGQGQIKFPELSICKESIGTVSTASFLNLTIKNDLDIVGEVTLGDIRNAWGELTHTGDEIIAWSAEMGKGYLYLPSGPTTIFSPDTGTGFNTLSTANLASNALAYLESTGVTGVTVVSIRNPWIYSPDRPGGSGNPIKLGNVDGWLRIGSCGVDGALYTTPAGDHELGNKNREGYEADVPFKTTLNFQDQKIFLLGQFVMSAVYDSGLAGSMELGPPVDVKELFFADMEITSTGHIVGGDVILPPGGVPLGYWKLQLVPTGDPNKAGVVSVRTGRIIFTAVGISEPIHFSRPFGLTWGEILADGNIGELFFDYNNYGQRFDGFQYSPHHISLSKYIVGTQDPYLATCGNVSFNFFAEHFVNIIDARNDAQSSGPYFGRLVTVPKNGEGACQKTDLHLHAEWNSNIAWFDFPDSEVKYNGAIQNGFIGKGTSGVNFIQSGDLKAEIELRSDVIDISLSSTDTHDLNFGLFARLGQMSGLSGCVRIEGPTLKQFNINGYLEYSAATGFGIIAPKAGYIVEVLMSVTPTSCTFMASGDLLLAVAGAALDISGYVHLSTDYSRHSSEGEFLGRIDCSSIIGGLEAEGQLTWFIDPNTQYLQGRLALGMVGWLGGCGLEGGLFIGREVPKNKAWVLLNTGSEHFGISEGLLPDHLTGLYGYGLLSGSMNFFVVSGGFELFAGMGAFSEIPPGLSSTWSGLVPLGLPYMIGSCGVHLHGEILGGLVSASAWANLDLRVPAPLYFEGKVGLEGCVLWVFCASVELTAGFDSGGFYARL